MRSQCGDTSRNCVASAPRPSRSRDRATSSSRPWCKPASRPERRSLPRMRNRPDKISLFKGRHVEREIIILCVRRYLRCQRSYRDSVEMTAESVLSIAHTTIPRSVRCYTPEFDKRWSRFSVQAGRSWRVDETYVRIRGQCAYLYRAVDSSGRAVASRLSARRNVASAKTFFRKAVRSQGRSPETVTLDGYVASHRAIRERQRQGSLPA